ncbi:MAG: hypothetical protein ACT4O2_04665 [Beijerinckiaceae bacterium]
MHTHPWRGIRKETLDPPDLDRIAEAAPQAAAKLRALVTLANLAAALVPSGGPASLTNIGHLKRFVDLLAWAPEGCGEAVAQLHPLTASQLVRAEEMIGEAGQLITAIAAETGAFRAAALDADTASVRARLAAGTSWFQRWKRAYRAASAELASWLTGPLPKSAAGRVSLVDLLIELKGKRNRFENLSQEAQALFGPLWRREDTDLSGLRTIVAWLRRVREEGFRFDLTSTLAMLGRPDLLTVYQTQLADEETAARAKLETIVCGLNLDDAAAFGHSSIYDVGIEDLAARLDGWASQVGRYSEWSKLASTDRIIRSYGLSALADRIANGALTQDNAVEEVRHARAEVLWQFARERNPQLSQLRDKDRTKLVETFR